LLGIQKFDGTKKIMRKNFDIKAKVLEIVFQNFMVGIFV